MSYVNYDLMKNIFFVLVLALTTQVNAQYFCGQWEATEKLKREYPELIPEIEKAENQLKNELINTQAQKTTTGTVYIIPVVFHVLHLNGDENISDAQIHDAMRNLNEDFRKLNADNALVVPAFQSISADAEIEFRLAQKDPSGNCTSGINRIETIETNFGNDGSKINQWPRNRYLNIWVVDNIDIAPGVAGYTYKPASVSFSPANDGIIIKHDYVGTIGTAAGRDGHTLTHEVGHWINLSHTWGNSNEPGLSSNCSIDDGVGDTPNTRGWQSCNLSGATCGNPIDNVQNYMDYSFCTNMFTQGQVDVMRAALTSSVSQRNNLSTPANLALTGTDGTNTLCVADFYSNSRSVCKDDSITIYDASYHVPTSWNWSFPTANPSSSSQKDPVIQFTTEGYANASLTVSNTSGSQSVSKTNYIRVLPVYGLYNPIVESFENGPYPNVSWDVYNFNNDAYTWVETTSASYSGTSSFMVNNFNNTTESIEELISPLYDLSNLSNATISFKVAFAKKSTATTTDQLMVYISNDCGLTWLPRFNRQGNSLVSAPVTSSSFIPSGTSEWANHSFTISSSGQLTDRTMFKFVFKGGGGNNIYIDDINISGNYNPVPLLFAPLNASVEPILDVKIDWKAVGDVDMYEYQVDTTSDFTSPVLIQGTKNYVGYDHSFTDTEEILSGLSNNTTYYWRVRTIKSGINSSWSAIWSFTVNESNVGISNENISKIDIQVLPNPFNKNTNIHFTFPNGGYYSVEIFDIQGKKVDVLLNNTYINSGKYNLNYSNQNLYPGILFIKLQDHTGGKIYIQKVAVF